MRFMVYLSIQATTQCASSRASVETMVCVCCKPKDNKHYPTPSSNVSTVVSEEGVSELGLHVNLRRGAVNNLVEGREAYIHRITSTTLLHSGTGVR